MNGQFEYFVFFIQCNLQRHSMICNFLSIFRSYLESSCTSRFISLLRFTKLHFAYTNSASYKGKVKQIFVIGRFIWCVCSGISMIIIPFWSRTFWDNVVSAIPRRSLSQSSHHPPLHCGVDEQRAKRNVNERNVLHPFSKESLIMQRYRL